MLQPLEPKGKFKCPKCDRTYTSPIATIGVPECTKHTSGAVKMIRTK